MPMIHIPSILWSMPPTWFCVNGERVVRVQDERYQNGVELRYTTFGGQGLLSVYDNRVTENPRYVLADSDRSITCDEHGNPTSVTGIQRYFPPSVVAPAYLEVGEKAWFSTEGDWSWHPDNNYPDGPMLGRYRHANGLYTDGVHLWHDETFEYWTQIGAVDVPEAWGWVVEYDRGFLYDVAARRLLQFTDNLTNTTYKGDFK